MSNANPGWYPEANNPSQMRYWDGQNWTEQTAPAGQSPSGPGGPATPPPAQDKKNWFLRHKILSAVLAIIVIAIIAAAAGSGGGSDDSNTASEDPTADATKNSDKPTKES